MATKIKRVKSDSLLIFSRLDTLLSPPIALSFRCEQILTNLNLSEINSVRNLN